MLRRVLICRATSSLGALSSAALFSSSSNLAMRRVTDERVTPLRLLALVRAMSSSAGCFLDFFGMIERKGVSVNGDRLWR